MFGREVAFMKRLFVLLLVMTLILVGCGRTETSTSTGATQPSQPVQPETPPTFEDCGEEAGMIYHKTIAAYSYFENEDVVSSKNLLFVPGGTVVSSEKGFAVYPYTEKNVLDQEALDATGQNVINKYMAVMAAGSVTLENDAYLRVAVEGKLSDVVLTYPEGTETQVRVVDTEYEAYGKDYDRITAALKSSPKQAVNYIFITDIHYDKKDLTSVQIKSLKQQMTLVTKMANESDAIDFVAIGGDITSGHYSKKSDAIKLTREILDPLKECKKPVMVLMGNHDDNSYSAGKTVYIEATANGLVSKAEWNTAVLDEYAAEGIVHDSTDIDSAYYYYDLPAKKTRLVCLDALDYYQELDEDGTVSASSLELDVDGNSKVGRTYWGYSVRQLRWLMDEALTADEGWNYVFLSHMNVTTENYGDELQTLLSAFRNRTAYNDAEVGTRDFAAATGQILVYHFGHNHGNRTEWSEPLGAWKILTGTANITQLSNNSPSSENYRGFGTDRECCFDVVSVTTQGVQKYGFGLPKDETLTNVP